MSTTHKTSASRSVFLPGRKSKERAPTSVSLQSSSDSTSFSAHAADDREEDCSGQGQQLSFPPLSSMALLPPPSSLRTRLLALTANLFPSLSSKKFLLSKNHDKLTPSVLALALGSFPCSLSVQPKYAFSSPVATPGQCRESKKF